MVCVMHMQAVLVKGAQRGKCGQSSLLLESDDAYAHNAEHQTLKLGSSARQRSGEGIMRRSGRPKGCFWRVCFLSAPLRFALKALRKLNGAEKKRTLLKHPFGRPFLRTTPSPLPWRAPKLGIK